MSLPPVEGHDQLRRLLANAAASGGLPQSVLLRGAPGIGKQRLALWLATVLQCERQTGCGECRSCRLASELQHPDIHWYFPLERPKRVAANKLREKLEEARLTELDARRAEPLRRLTEDAPTGIHLGTIENLRQRAIRRPAMGPRTVFIVGRAEQMVSQQASQEAANAFLKLLEEPPGDVHIFLTSSRPGALLPTVLSRVLSIRVLPLAVAELALRVLRDKSPWVRADAALALGDARGLEARERLIVVAREDSEARVRVAALNALQAFGSHPDLARFARSVFDDRFSWATMGAAGGLVATADPRGAYAWITEALYQDSPHDQLRGHLFGALGKLDGRDVDAELRRWAGDESIHPSARAEAVRLLGQRRGDTTKNSRFLAGLLGEESFRLRAAAVDALTELADDQAHRALRAYYPTARTVGERRAIEASRSLR